MRSVANLSKSVPPNFLVDSGSRRRGLNDFV
jgi:hypothetical protein